MEELLAPHQKCGWDFDGTLYDHPAAAEMHAYIMNHPEKQHYIVTFRSHGWGEQVFDDLASRHLEFPGPEHFDGVITCPDEIFERFWDAHQRQKLGLPIDMTDVQPYVEWKAKICKKHGITVLIDDNPLHVQPGCDRYGVLHVHPDDF